MTHQNDYTVPQDLAGKGLEAVPELLRVLINQVMQAERAKYLQADEYERTEERKGHANGYKPKTVRTRVGKITFSVPQVREGGFYPSALEKGLRSERALVATLAEMYVQGVSTRKVKAITEELCGVEISAMQVSRATAQLDEILQQWRERPLGEIAYLYVDARYEKVREASQVREAAVLLATGITPEGERQVLGVSVSLSEHETHPLQGASRWKAFLKSLKERGTWQCAVAKVPVPPAAERWSVPAQAVHETGSGSRYPGHVHRHRKAGRGKASAGSDPEVRRICSEVVCLVGGEPVRGVHGVQLPAGTPQSDPHHQQPGTDQPGDPQAHQGCWDLSQRGILPQADLSAPDGDQRRMADRQALLQVEELGTLRKDGYF